jgi:voltage-gated potassium channel Kch
VLWRRYWWAALGVVLLGALAVAFAGADGSFWARLERSLTLLPVANRRDTDGLPPSVKVAYFVAAGVILFVTYRVAIALAGARAHEARARLMRNHTVVHGLGGQGQALVESLLGSTKVVAVEQDAANPAVRRLRDLRAVVLVGDGTDPLMVRRTNARRARHVVALCGPDAVNARIGATHTLAARPGRRAPDLFVHISDPRLYTFLLHHSFASEAGPRLELFNVYERGARGLLREATEGDRSAWVRVLVVGAGELGLALVSQLGRDRYERGDPATLRVDVVDRDAQARVDLLGERYCKLRDVCELVPHDVDVESPAFDRLLAQHPTIQRVDICFVCFDNDTLTIATALNLLDQSAGRFPGVARVSEKSEGIACMIERAHSRYADAATFRPVVLAHRAVQADLVLEGIRGQVARQIHETYRGSATDGPYAVPWASLTDEGRQRNTRHAASISDQLESVGYRLGPLIDWGEPLPEFAPDEVEVMSKLEHQRWVAERLDAGWRHAAARDDDARLHPDLVPWDDLPDERREINRRLVRMRPSMLAAVGIQVYRA